MDEIQEIPEYNANTDVPVYNQLLQKCWNDRQNAYSTELGGWHQQLDMIFHDFDAWKAAIQAVKDRYPKP